MSDNQDALRLADALERRGYASLTMQTRLVDQEIAAHIRRLVAENEALKKRNKQSMHYAMGKAAELRVLSTKLKDLAQAIEAHHDTGEEKDE